MSCAVNRSTACLVAVSFAAAAFAGQQKVSKALASGEHFGTDGYNAEKDVWDVYCRFLSQ